MVHTPQDSEKNVDGNTGAMRPEAQTTALISASVAGMRALLTERPNRTQSMKDIVAEARVLSGDFEGLQEADVATVYRTVNDDAMRGHILDAVAKRWPNFSLSEFVNMLTASTSPQVNELIARQCLARSDDMTQAQLSRAIQSVQPGTSAHRLFGCMLLRFDIPLEAAASVMSLYPNDNRVLGSIMLYLEAKTMDQRKQFCRYLSTPTAKLASAIFFHDGTAKKSDAELLGQLQAWKSRGSMSPGEVHAMLVELSQREHIPLPQIFALLDPNPPADYVRALTFSPRRKEELRALYNALGQNS